MMRLISGGRGCLEHGVTLKERLHLIIELRTEIAGSGILVGFEYLGRFYKSTCIPRSDFKLRLVRGAGF